MNTCRLMIENEYLPVLNLEDSCLFDPVGRTHSSSESVLESYAKSEYPLEELISKGWIHVSETGFCLYVKSRSFKLSEVHHRVVSNISRKTGKRIVIECGGVSQSL